MNVELEPLEIIAAVYHGGSMSEHKQCQIASGEVIATRQHGLSPFERTLVGTLGEMAVGKLLGIKVKPQLLRGGDGGTDLVYRGQKIQVKTVRRFYKDVFAKMQNPDEFVSDYLFLCHVDSAVSIKVHGFVSKQRFHKYAAKTNFEHGDTWAISQQHFIAAARFDEAIDHAANSNRAL